MIDRSKYNVSIKRYGKQVVVTFDCPSEEEAHETALIADNTFAYEGYNLTPYDTKGETAQ